MNYKFNRTGATSFVLGDGSHISFMPGDNEMIDSDWEKIKDRDQIAEWIKDKVLEVSEDPKAKAKKDG